MKRRKLDDYTNLLQLATRQFVAIGIPSPRKLLNAAHVLLELRARRTVLRSKPVVLKLEPSSFCNLRCPYCHPDGNSFGGIMTEETFQFLLTRIPLQSFLKCSLYMLGEPMMNKNLHKMAHAFTRRGIPTGISTNMHLCDKRGVEALLDSGLTWVLICIDGADQETYEQYRVRGSLQKVIENTTLLVESRKARGARRPIIEVAAIEFNHNRHQIGEIERLSRNLGADRFTVKRDVFNQIDQLATGSQKRCRTCYFLYESFCVDYDGSVVPCCIYRYPFGNLYEQTFEEIWNNEKFVAARAWFASGRGIKDDRFDLPCYVCPLFK